MRWHARNWSRHSLSPGELACALLLASAGAASGSSLTVPLDAPTIQVALDARPDTVLILAGRYQETPVVRYPTVLIGIRSEPELTRPILDGLWFVPAGLLDVLLFSTQDLDFLGEVHIRNDQPSFFELSGCRFGAGFFEWSRYLETRGLRFTGCEIVGEAWVAADGYVVLDSCVIRGNVIVGDGRCELSVRRCLFQDSAQGWALSQRTSSIQTATIDSCIFERCYQGILLETDVSVSIRNSVVRDCVGSGIVVGRHVGFITDNLVERCGGYGISSVSSDTLAILRNRVSHCGGGGQASAGINANIMDSAIIAENATWANATNGLVVGLQFSLMRVDVRNNTSVGNGQAGIVSACEAVPVYSDQRFAVVNNIASHNGTHGIHWLYPNVTSTECNNWFGNTVSDVFGRDASPGDVTLDPKFCSAANGDFHLPIGSPLLGHAGCGLVGALSVGCDTVVKPVPVRAFRIVSVGPNPGPGRFAIKFSLPIAGDITLDVYDILGRSVSSLARGMWPAGVHVIEWDGPRESGVFLVRFRYPGGEESKRIVRTG